jgi:hypothetical protein
MKDGDRFYWTKQREKALLKLGKKATIPGSKHKDWVTARQLCPKESELLKDRTTEQLRKIYTRILKSSQGLCVKNGCELTTVDGHRYCVKHRKENAARSLIFWNKIGNAKRKAKE